MPTAELDVGSRVKYRRRFLRSIACYAGPLPFARGVITGLRPFNNKGRLATVAWDGNPEEVPTQVNTFNLTDENDPEHGDV